MSEFNPSARTKDNPLGRVPHERDRIGEIQDRLRRIETRLTKYMQERGFETRVQKVEAEGDGIIIPSLDVRLRDMLIAAPETTHRFFNVWHQGEFVGYFTYDAED